MRGMTLTEFLLERINEDEDVAFHGDGGILDLDDAWFSKRRVVAECEAKRRIVELHRSTLGSEVHKNGRWDSDAGVMVACRYWWCGVCDADRDYGFTGGPDEGCETLRILALPYSDHPDYDEAWRV